ncbi:hypothetical protein C0991_011154 [Blastosporella zonata]|nr:hypothetical protein C0991_011154 [Blastosporella zonata]
MVKRDSSIKKEHRPRAGGKGKQPKHFLNKDAALDLAAAIAGVQEEKTLSRAEKHHQTQKETKALLAARRTQNKREKVKRKKEREHTSTSEIRDESINKEVPQTRKRVSFA